MEKLVSIDDKQIRLKSSAGTLVKYKNQFGREWLDDVNKITNNFKKYSENPKDESTVLELVPILYDMTWALAKTANNAIETPDVWFDQFEMYGIMNSIEDIMDLIISNFGGNEKKAMVPQEVQQEK